MKRSLSLLLCLGIAQCANAAVLFYKNNLTVTVCGAGTTKNRNYSGFTLIDSETGDVVFVSADVKSLRFKVEQPTHKFTMVQATQSTSRSVLELQTGAAEGMTGKGGNTWLVVGDSQAVLCPSTFTVAGCDAYVPPGLTDAYCFEFHGVLVYDKADTMDATNNGRSLADSTDKVRSILNARGYHEAE